MTELASRTRTGGEVATGSKLEVRLLGAGEEGAWTNYVRQHPRATVFHGLSWMRVLETLRNRPCYLIATTGGEIRGVLPLFECTRFPLRRELLSLPHTNFAGPLADGEEAESALIREASQRARQLGASALFLKDRHPGYSDVPRLDGFVTFERDLPASSDELLASFGKGARYWVRRGFTRNELVADTECELEEFYTLLTDTYQRLGTPLYPIRFFEAILREFGQDAVMLVVRRHGEPLAAVLAIQFQNTLTSLFSGEAHGARSLGVNPFKYFRLMEWAVDQGITRYNFGRSRLTNPGAIAFKRHLGFEVTPLPYRVVTLAEGFQPADPNRGLYRVASQAWSRLPHALAERVGPRIVRYFPH